MNCPFCGYTESKVTDSRISESGIRRRRECLSCGQRYTTNEKVELAGVQIVKKDGRRVEFDRDKVISGVRKAGEKRPIPLGAIEALADEVESAVYAQGKAEIPATFIGELVMERLRQLDHIAYIRFASVYRAFADVEDLKQELAALEAGWRRPGVPAAQLALINETKKSPHLRPIRNRRQRLAGGDQEPRSDNK